MKKQAVAYARVSTTDQVEFGISLEAQRAEIERYASYHDLDVIAYLEDAGVSASVPLHKRPQGCKLFEFAEREDVSAILTIRLDRIFRNTSECLTATAQWEQHGVALHLLDLDGQSVDTSTAIGKFFFTVIAAAAEMERTRTSERTKHVMQHLKEQRRRVGSVPYGWARDPKDPKGLIPNDEEQDMILQARHLQEGGMSLFKIAKELNRRGFLSRTGKPLVYIQVRRMLRDELLLRDDEDFA